MDGERGRPFFRQFSGTKSPTNEQIWIDPYTNERVWVFNPMHIVQLTKQTKSRFVRIVEGFKSFSNKWFSHVLLLFFLIGYGFLGAYIFVSLEEPIEKASKGSVTKMRERIVRELWWSSQQFSKGWWQRLARLRLKEYERQLHESCIAQQTTDSEQRVWNFWQALFFCSTIFTTIGYGHVVPKTDAGRVASIIYAFIGIPLLLMVLTDLGKLFTRAIKFVFKHFRKIYYNRQVRKVRRAVNQPLDAVNKTVSSVLPGFNEDGSNSDNASKDPGAVSRARQLQRMESEAGESETIPEFEVDDEFNLPISIAITLLLIYMMLGAAVFTLWEEWTFFESFYFVYISLSTIGFGDYVPEHPMFMMCTFIYLLFGLALTSMCINVVQEKLSATFQKAKMRIGATMGLDIPEMVQEEMQQDNANIMQQSQPPAPPLRAPPNQTKILKDEGIGESWKARREQRKKEQNEDLNNNNKGNKNVDFK